MEPFHSKAEVIELLRHCIGTVPKNARQELLKLLSMLENSSANEFYGHNTERSAHIDWSLRKNIRTCWARLAYQHYRVEYVAGSKGWKTAKYTRKGWTLVDSHFVTFPR